MRDLWIVDPAFERRSEELALSSAAAAIQHLAGRALREGKGAVLTTGMGKSSSAPTVTLGFPASGAAA
jgi:hypothetical protein